MFISPEVGLSHINRELSDMHNFVGRKYNVTTIKCSKAISCSCVFKCTAAVVLILVPAVETSIHPNKRHNEIVCNLLTKYSCEVVYLYPGIVSVKGKNNDKYHIPLSLNSLYESYFSHIHLILLETIPASSLQL